MAATAAPTSGAPADNSKAGKTATTALWVAITGVITTCCCCIGFIATTIAVIMAIKETKRIQDLTDKSFMEVTTDNWQLIGVWIAAIVTVLTMLAYIVLTIMGFGMHMFNFTGNSSPSYGSCANPQCN